MRTRTALLLAASAGVLAACAGPTGGMQRATVPAQATGQGLVSTPDATSATPASAAAASGHEHTQADRPHVH